MPDQSENPLGTKKPEPNILTLGNADENDDDDEDVLLPIKWINIIFLPFEFWWQSVVICAVIVKCIFGPLEAVYRPVVCSEENFTNMDNIPYQEIKMLYNYCCDPIILIDLILHIIHRQVQDEAVKREHMPKPVPHIFIDILALSPIYEFFSDKQCPDKMTLWPQILELFNFLLIYRIPYFFSLFSTHSYKKLFCGYFLVMFLILHITTCFFVLVTTDGLCKNCHSGLYDWRKDMDKLTNVDRNSQLDTHCFAWVILITTFVLHNNFRVRPRNYAEFFITPMLLMVSFIVTTFIVKPKLFSECVYRLTHIYDYHPRVTRVIEETKRRNPSPTAHIDVERFYSASWSRQYGINSLPSIINKLPHHLKNNLYQELTWAVFYHSPTFRNTSGPYKRWLSEHIKLHYKLPGEKFFTGPHCYTNLYYLKSGIVQLISVDDSSAPLLSLSGGTIFGDISFFMPPVNRKVIARCMTYCEVFSVSRHIILSSLHKFPADRQNIMKLVKDRLNHAHDLNKCKQQVQGLSRSESESIAWIKSRWWQIADVVRKWKITSIKNKCEIPPEEKDYHCARYIGQLVLSDTLISQGKSIFSKERFPWILMPHSTFGDIWSQFLYITVSVALIILPQNITREPVQNVTWFKCFILVVDIIYAADVVISLITVKFGSEHVTSSFSVMIQRFKTKSLMFDILSTFLVEKFFYLFGMNQYQILVRYNRLVKTYILFYDKYKKTCRKTDIPIVIIYSRLLLAMICAYHITSFVLFWFIKRTPGFNFSYFYGHVCLVGENCTTTKDPELNSYGVMAILVGWIFERTELSTTSEAIEIWDYLLESILEPCYFLFTIYVTSKCLAALFLQYSKKIRYLTLACNIKKFYKSANIHPDLFKRLNIYLYCHWKYYYGMDILCRNLLSDEPYDIHWKLYGELSEHIIAECDAFKGANPALIKELAHKVKFLIHPKDTVIFLLGIKLEKIIWIAQGTIKCEYLNDNGDAIETFLSGQRLLTTRTLFFDRPSLKTYTAATDCEILYIEKQEFFQILKRHPDEWAIINKCKEEFELPMKDLFFNYVQKHKNYQKKLRLRIFHAKKPDDSVKKEGTFANLYLPAYFKEFRTNPESTFIQHWLAFRAFSVFFYIFTSSLLGGVFIYYRRYLLIITYLYHIVGYADIILKLFLPYYDHRGLIISDPFCCIMHYLRRGFLMDVLSTVFTNENILGTLSGKVEHIKNIYMTLFSFCSLYLLTGYLNYLADQPSVTSIYIQMIKWQIVLFLLGMAASKYFISWCIKFHFDKSGNLSYMTRINETCWIPNHFAIDPYPNLEQLKLAFAVSLDFVQCSLTQTYIGGFYIYRNRLEMILISLCLSFVFRFHIIHCMMLQILKFRTTSIFQEEITQLKSFLASERIGKSVVEKALNHLYYNWKRTQGSNKALVVNERIGIVLRQDLTYYFYKKTFRTANTLLHGGDDLEREFASNVHQIFFLRGHEVIREMDLSCYVYFVHRGRIAISENGIILATLTKGSMFGLLDGVVPRAARTTAYAQDYADVLEISIQRFQQLITDEVRENIASNDHSKLDYLAIKHPVSESPYNSLMYLLRGQKLLKLPWMEEPVTSESSKWMWWWLFCVWVLGPVLSSVLTLTLLTIPTAKGMSTRYDIDLCLRILEVFDVIHMEIAVAGTKCVYKYIRLKQFKKWELYIDIISLTIPIITYFTNLRRFQFARLLRLHYLYQFQKELSKSYQEKSSSFILKIVFVLLIVHMLTCGWIFFACELADKSAMKTHMLNDTDLIDPDQWRSAHLRPRACPVSIKGTNLSSDNYAVPTKWQMEYFVTLTYILILFVKVNIDIMHPLDLKQNFYKIFIWYLLLLVDMWIASSAINFVYTKYRQKFKFDYQVKILNKYLARNGVSKYIQYSIKQYTDRFWLRTKGNILPEIINHAPHCLREDIFSALYMHHLLTPTLFRLLPDYFLRQLVLRVHRRVIFPGQCIIQEGDILPVIYFIHEGEVEKWYTDSKGNSRLASVLTINGYFGLTPGLFPNTPYKFTYYTRTVVDFITLNLNDWEDLLNGYPDLKHLLYNAAMKPKP